MQMEKAKKTKRIKPWELFWYVLAWTAICLGLILIGAFAAKLIFG